MNIATFDLNLLKIFDALMRERSVTRAGDRVGLSQPAMSGALNRLRRCMGDPLFIRIGNEMVPTARAEAICEGVRAALGGIEHALVDETCFDPATATLAFTLQGADMLSMRMMPNLFEAVTREAPKVRMRFVDSSHGEVPRLLRDGGVDVAFECPLDPPQWISSALLFPSPFVVIAAQENPAIAQSGIKPGAELPLRLFLSLPQAMRSVDGSMTGATDAALAKAGHRREVVLTLPHFQAIGLAVAKGRLIAVVPQQFAQAASVELGLAIYKMPIGMPAPDLKMYWHSRHDHDGAHRWLRGKIFASLAALGWYSPPPKRAGLRTKQNSTLG